MEYEIKEIGGYQILIVLEKIDLYNISDFKKILFDLTSGKYSHVAIDLKANYSDMSSSVIGALISAQKKNVDSERIFCSFKYKRLCSKSFLSRRAS